MDSELANSPEIGFPASHATSFFDLFAVQTFTNIDEPPHSLLPPETTSSTSPSLPPSAASVSRSLPQHVFPSASTSGSHPSSTSRPPSSTSRPPSSASASHAPPSASRLQLPSRTYWSDYNLSNHGNSVAPASISQIGGEGPPLPYSLESLFERVCLYPSITMQVT